MPQLNQKSTRTLERNIEARVMQDIGDTPLNRITAVSLRRIVHGAVHAGVVESMPNVSFVDVDAPSAARAAGAPVRGAKVKAVWDALDHMAKRGHEPTLQEIRNFAKAKKMNDNTARVQFYRWRANRATGA